MSIFGAIPFVLTGDIPFYVDALFETISGFTTTGSSILTDVESISKASLFWRSFSHWIGGMGVLIFTLAFLPKVGGRTQVLVQAEATGPVSSKLVPKTSLSSRILYTIYIAFTGAETLALCLAGMPFYDALLTSFATACTGGFSVRNASIAAYGILQPLTVRQQGAVYELVAGERRWRAARIAGLRQVPCLLARVDEEDAALLALIENLQRRDLDYMEEAAAIARLLRRYGLSQQQAAEKLGRSQSAVANKLRLLRLEEPVAEALHHYGLTERHARALLRLEDPEQRLAAVEHIGKNQLNVADAEAYIDRLVAQNQTTQPRRRSAYIIKDVRLFLNSVDRGVRLMQTAGVGAKVSRRDTEDAICLTVTIPRAKPQKEVS